MGKYVYKRGNEEISRSAFSRFVAEHCEVDVTYCCGLGIGCANYEKGEAVTKRMQGQAYRDYKNGLTWQRPKTHGSASVIYCGVRGGCLEVDYWPSK